MQSFMWSLKEDTRVSIDLMVLNWKLPYTLSINNKHLKWYFK
jgi:hypothetical protein